MRKTALMTVLFTAVFAASSFAGTVSGRVKNVRLDKKTIYLETETAGTVKALYNPKTQWPVKKFSNPETLKNVLVRIEMNDQGEAVRVERI